MSQTIITCPTCNKKVGEQELKASELIKLYCENCKEPFVVETSLKVKKYTLHEKEE